MVILEMGRNEHNERIFESSTGKIYKAVISCRIDTPNDYWITEIDSEGNQIGFVGEVHIKKATHASIQEKHPLTLSPVMRKVLLCAITKEVAQEVEVFENVEIPRAVAKKIEEYEQRQGYTK